MASDKDLGERLMNVEMALSHLQQDYETLNQVVIKQARVIDQLKSQLVKLGDQLESVEEGQESRKPEDEKPPHY